MNYKGVIIKESLDDTSVLKDVKILNTKIEKVVDKHKTPWLKQWTLHTVEISEEKANDVAKKLSFALDKKHEWYADYKNATTHYIIYRNNIFIINRTSKEQYEAAKQYGISLGIPEYQVDFSPEIK